VPTLLFQRQREEFVVVALLLELEAEATVCPGRRKCRRRKEIVPICVIPTFLERE
jgi:hypothetical protein